MRFKYKQFLVCFSMMFACNVLSADVALQAAQEADNQALQQSSDKSSQYTVPVVRESERVRVYSTKPDKQSVAKDQQSSVNTSSSVLSVKAVETEPTQSLGGPTDSFAWELLQKLELMQQEMARLRGKLEEQSRQLKRLDQDFTTTYEDLDHRLISIEGGSDLTKDKAIKAPGVAISNQEKATADLSSFEEEKSAYAAAQQLLKQKQLDAALSAFAEFVGQYPDSVLTPNAFYWMGELHLASQPPDLSLAQSVFEQILTDHPKHRKVPNVMYKLALIDVRQGQKQNAERRLEKLIKNYPKSSSAKLAQSQLESLKQE